MKDEEKIRIGHDAPRLRRVSGPTAASAVKDRVTGRKPLAALYTSRSCCRRPGNPG